MTGPRGAARGGLTILSLIACALAGCGSTEHTTVMTTPLVAHSDPPARALWGLDATSVQDADSLAAARARYGADPRFVGRYLTTGGGPSILTPDEVALYAHRTPRPIAVVLVADVFARCENVAMGQREADLAAGAAAVLDIPADHSIAIFQDLERRMPAVADCLAAYADELTARGYRPGWYGNPILGHFSPAFCAAAATDPRVAGALIWTSQTERRPGGPATQPPFAPARPRCAHGHTVLWQYSRDQLVGPASFDINELGRPVARGVLWHP